MKAALFVLWTLFSLNLMAGAPSDNLAPAPPIGNSGDPVKEIPADAKQKAALLKTKKQPKNFPAASAPALGNKREWKPAPVMNK